MTAETSSNPALEWAVVLVDEMARAGLTAVVIAPGSRSTPLTLAFSSQQRIKVYSLLDERGAAFFALGLALESGRPAAVLCTSGTAAANFLPAVIEASQSHVPLMVLTADRPAEVRGTGANQTIDQVGLFGSYVRYAQDLLPPAADAAPLLNRYLRTSVDRAVASSLGPVPGPVQLNIPFRKPLEPAQGETMPDFGKSGRPDGAPFTRIRPATPQTELPDIDWPARGIILAGPRCVGGDFPQALAILSLKTGYPIVADALSGVRFGPWTRSVEVFNPQVCRALQEAPPDLVLQFGAVPVSNPAMTLLGALSIAATRVSVQPHGTWHDDAHGLSHLVHADPVDFCRKMAEHFPDPVVDPGWLDWLRKAELAYWAAVDAAAVKDYFEGLVLQDVVSSLPEDGMLFVSNSLAVRHLDELTRPMAKHLRVFCNRGASGIDGTISTALGVGASGGKPLALVLGDLSFYHDLNGLLALKRCGVPATIVLLNNDGGGIFRRLPVAAFEPVFTELFLTPHGLDFAPVAAMFSAEYRRVDDRSSLQAGLAGALGAAEAHIVEMHSDSALHEEARLAIAADWPQRIKKTTGLLLDND